MSSYCPLCDGILKREERSMVYTFMEQPYIIAQIGDWCQKCGEGFLHKEDIESTRTIREEIKNDIKRSKDGK